MPKSFLSDDPFAALDGSGLPARGRRPRADRLFLLVPALGLILIAVGMHARPGASAPAGDNVAVETPEKSERAVSGEGRTNQLVSIEAARRNVVRWRRANCCGAATPHRRAKMRAWEQGYRERLALFARMYPGLTCRGRKDR